MKKVSMYRVITRGAKAKGMVSAFGKFTNDVDARKWAIEYGKKMQADSIEFAKKNNRTYNHYDTIEIINL